MGLPEIIFKLKEKASTAVVRSGSGVVLLSLPTAQLPERDIHTESLQMYHLPTGRLKIMTT